MKKITLVLVLTLTIAMLCVSSLAIAEQQPVAVDFVTQQEVTDFVKRLCELNKVGDKEDIIAFIQASFSYALGETDQSPITSETTQQQVAATTQSNVRSILFTYGQKNYVNVEARISSQQSDGKQIIVGAHYDVTKGEGAADNACGMAALYQTMKVLSQNKDKLPFDVVFVAFDGEEGGMLGSDNYVSETMSATERVNTLVMFNIDSIALGDNMYFMCENKHTDLADLVLSNSEGIAEKPYAVGTYGVFDMFGYGYYEFVQGSDHTSFRLQGIPIAFFFSGTYEADVWGFRTSADSSKNTINSARDTFENLQSSGADYVGRIVAVSNAIVETVLSDEFSDVAQNARNQLVNLDLWYNPWWPKLIVAGVLILLAVLTFFYYRKLQKKSLLGTAEIKTQTVFDKPNAEDIFSFKSDNHKNGEDVEDIFTFKK